MPIVDLRGSHRPENGAMLDTDPRMVTRMAAEHFLDIGFRHFAYIGYPGVDFSDRRIDAYREYLKSRGMEVSVYTPAHAHSQPTFSAGKHAANWKAPRSPSGCNHCPGRSPCLPVTTFEDGKLSMPATNRA